MLKTPALFAPMQSAPAQPGTLAAAANFVFYGDDLLLCSADLSLPSLPTLEQNGLVPAHWHPVGQLRDQYCQTGWLPKSVEAKSPAVAPPGHHFSRLRPLFGAMDDGLLSVAGKASQIANWARTHQYCGSCGAQTLRLDGERCMKCPACGHMAYPRISPAMMVLIKKQDSILLALHKNSPAKFFTALAGFVEAGESVEEAIHREVFEEVGLRVKNLSYFASQPWPFPHSLMLAYTAEYDDGEIKVDETEIAEARWFGPGEPLPIIPFSLSIASALIRANLPAGSVPPPSPAPEPLPALG